jgi:glycosyltransferase involved in cell wall biosynthesis
MLEKWELKSKGLGKNIKKGLYARLFERASLNHSTCLRALSEREAEDYANFGATPPIAVIPNGIGTLIRREPTELFNNFSQFRGKKIVLFLARIHQKKGILNLVRAWPEVVRNHPDAHLAIAGGEYEDTGDKMRQLVAGLGISRSVTAMGVINGETKIQALSAASFLCLPSFSEGLSVTVLESLSIGLPVIVTRACNIDIAAKRGAGFVSSNSPEKLSETLVDALALPADKHEAMSNAARELASSEFHWNKVAEKMALVYAWLLGAEKPSFVLN